ncbi:hypothetical protein OG21DRAFT_1525255, partial [Imleria badia]
VKRPVKYFWGVHDFVRGLRGALLGHEYLTKIGLLHRDISENNIALGLYPWQERGYLIDFDMDILQKAEKATSVSSTEPDDELSKPAEQSTSSLLMHDEKMAVKALRTVRNSHRRQGTLPYMPFNVLLGDQHTHFDDVMSFFYVLLLFFFSYAGPLPKTVLEDAYGRGFALAPGSGCLSHMRDWPKKYADWGERDPQVMAPSKGFDILSRNGPRYLEEGIELRECLKNNWPQYLHCPIRCLLRSTFTAFSDSAKGGTGRAGVSHAQFINILDKWLEEHSGLEYEYSNCPDFWDSRLD